MGISARWKHFKIYVELAANFALLILSSLEGLVKVPGGIWIVLCLWEGKGMQLKHKVVSSIRNRLFVFCKTPSQSKAQPGAGGVAVSSRAAPCISGLSAKASLISCI